MANSLQGIRQFRDSLSPFNVVGDGDSGWIGAIQSPRGKPASCDEGDDTLNHLSPDR
jgi:hypothetical protein